MQSVEQVLSHILTAASVLSTQTVPILDSLGRTAGENIAADIPQPPFDNSAVDGYAVRSEDTQAASAYAPCMLTCVMEIAAGDWPQQTVASGECARIMTGAPLPPGADSVVMVEDTRVSAAGRIEIREPVSEGAHVRYAGEDRNVGDLALSEGTYLGAAQIGLLAALGRERINVVRAPRVAVISTGDEIVEVQQDRIPAPGKIRNSNTYALAALAREAGADICARLHVPDDLEATIAALRDCATRENEGGKGADVIITAGGVSVGDRDWVKPALETVGTMELWRVAMKPGKPLAFGRIGDTLFFGLPGNPVSAQVTFELFVRPVLRKMAGRTEADWLRRQVEAHLSADVAHVPGRREYVRARVDWQDGRYAVQPLSGQSSANLHSLALANALLIVPEQAALLRAGEQAAVLLLD